MNQPCARCAAVNAGENRFCQSCGHPLQTNPGAAQALYAPPEYAGGRGGYAPFSSNGYTKASLGSRFWASVLDGLIGLGLSLPSLLCFYFALMKSKDYDNYDPGGVAMLFVLGLFFYLLPLTYSLIKDGLRGGQSWGKKNMYLMVVDLSINQPCGIGKSIARNLVSTMICIVPVVGWLVEPLMVLASRDGRKLGDLSVNTQVIQIDQFQHQN